MLPSNPALLLRPRNVIAAGGGPASVSGFFADSADRGFADNYTSVAITFVAGTVIVFVQLQNNIGNITNVTIGGVTATNIAGASNTHIGAWFANSVPGGSGTVVVSVPGVAAIAVNGATITSTSTSASASNNKIFGGSVSHPFDISTSSVAIPTNGVGLIGLGVANNSTALGGATAWAAGSGTVAGTDRSSMVSQIASTNNATIVGCSAASAGTFEPSVTPATAGVWDFFAPNVSLVSWGP